MTKQNKTLPSSQSQITNHSEMQKCSMSKRGIKHCVNVWSCNCWNGKTTVHIHMPRMPKQNEII